MVRCGRDRQVWWVCLSILAMAYRFGRVVESIISPVWIILLARLVALDDNPVACGASLYWGASHFVPLQVAVGSKASLGSVCILVHFSL